MPAGPPRGLQKSFLQGPVLCRTQIVIPKSLIQAVLKQLHDQAGHLGIFKTTEKVKEQDIRTWVQDCVQCQQCNPPIPQAQAPLGTIQATYPFEKMSWDIMRPMPVTERHNKYILVITDVFTKRVKAFPLQNTTTETLAACLVNEVVCRYGAPAVIHSDQGANHCGDMICSMCHLLGIQQTRTSAYSHQSIPLFI